MKAGIPPPIVGESIDEQNATPWAQQVARDLRRLEVTDEGAAFLRKMDEQQMTIFLTTEVRDTFLALDMAELRAKELSVFIPPPDYSLQQGEHSHMDVEKFKCEICDMTFASNKSILLHFRTKHSLQKLSSELPVHSYEPMLHL